MLIIRSTKQPSRPEFSQLCRRPSMSAAWSKSAIRFESLGRQTAGFGVSLRQWGLTGGSSHTFSTIQEASLPRYTLISPNGNTNLMDTWNLHSLRLAVAGSSQNSSDAAGKPLPSGEPDFQCSEDLPALFKTPQQLKSFKIEFVPLQSGPYSDINVPFQKALQHGSNTYSTLSTADQDIIFDALKQRCHSSSQLRRHRFVLLGDNYQGIRLPAGIMLQDFLPSRPRSDSAPKRRAPPGKVTNWRTKYSGITSRALREAKSRRNCLASWRAARAELWKYTAEAVFGGVESFRRVWGLKDLMKQLVEIDIQNHGRQGHDCVEDTLATRELALWCVQNPRRLEAWGSERRDNMEKQGIERDRARTEGQRERENCRQEIAHRS
ncbi:hypothetical protein PspLS_11108 [Pyricularia sp. CBS 133598]|nr:hypothetical protein PspLS_11108 [Pyricularia sp. CBS 133598]